MTETTQRVLNDRYRIEALVGRGGMADVYRAMDLSLERPVAVKMLRPDLARDPQFQTRFRREAQSSASLNHPNIVGVYDTGQARIPDNGHEGRTPFIVMEYVDGVTLRHVLHGTPGEDITGEGTPPPPPPPDAAEATGGHDRSADSDVLDMAADGAEHRIPEPLQTKIDQALSRPLTEREAAGYMSGVLSALSYSHEKGIVHRDIKPSNVMVSGTGEVKVMDFGIARALADSAQTMTQTSAVVGTAQYLSPEQARGELVDHRSDLYSAGCVLFELLTNRPPFTGETPVAVAYQHVREEPPTVSEYNNLVTPAMESVVAKALTKDPALRFQTAEEFDAAVQKALLGIPVDSDEHPTVALAAVGAGETNRSFDDVVAPAAIGSPLSARTPEDPDIDDYYSDYRQPRRSRRGIWAVLWVIVVIGFIAGAAFIVTRMLNAGEDTLVPEVAGLPTSEAVSELTDANLSPQLERQGHAEIEEDHAIGTEPEAGTELEAGSEITLLISAGPDSVIVPDGLQGMTEEQARSALEEAGLDVGDISEEDHESVGAGALITTDPAAGAEVELGSSVDLVLSTGMTQLPSGLIGTWWQTVSDELEAAGFTAEVDWVLDEDCDPDPGGDCYDVFEMSVDGDQVGDGDRVPQNAHVILRATWPGEEEEEEDDTEDEDADGQDDEDDADEPTETPDEDTENDDAEDTDNGDGGESPDDENTGNGDEE